MSSSNKFSPKAPRPSERILRFQKMDLRKRVLVNSSLRNHIRSHSEIIGCYRNGASSADSSRRYSYVSYQNGIDDKENVDAKEQSYRNIYSLTSPDRELQTINSAIFNVQRWLRQKRQSLQADFPSPCSRGAVAKQLLAEVGAQQDTIDLLLDKGKRHLRRHDNIALQVDLDNLSFLWSSYLRDLQHLNPDPSQSPFFSPLQLSPCSDLSKEDSPSNGNPLPRSSTPHGLGSWTESGGSTPDPFLVPLGRCVPTSSPSQQGPDPPQRSSAQNLDVNVQSPPVGEGFESKTEGSSGATSQDKSPARGRVGLESLLDGAHTARGIKGLYHIHGRSPYFDCERYEVEKIEVDGGVGLQQVAENFIQILEKEAQSISGGQDTEEKGEDHLKKESLSTITEEEEKEPTESGVEHQATQVDPSNFANRRRSSSEESGFQESHSGSAEDSTSGEGTALSLSSSSPEDPREPSSDPSLAALRCDFSGARQILQGQEEDGKADQEDQGVGGEIDWEGETEAAQEDTSDKMQKSGMEEPIPQVQLMAGAAFEIKPVVHGGEGRKTPHGLDDEQEGEAGETALPTGPKRRKMNSDSPSSVSNLSSRSTSPGLGLGVGGEWLGAGGEWLEDSMGSTPGSGSPLPRSPGEFRRRYRKDELWRAIKSDYQYLMDKEIIETCKSTETDLTFEDEASGSHPQISFGDFLQQYGELTHWLTQIQKNIQRPGTSLSEKYLNQAYHEEMAEQASRRQQIFEEAKLLTARFPHLQGEVTLKLQQLTALWESVEKALGPRCQHETDAMLQDLETDLTQLRGWLKAVEDHLKSLAIQPDWTAAQFQSALTQHQVLQRDIESHSALVSAVLRLSQRLEHDERACADGHERANLHLVALTLEKRWHAIWLQSLEWKYLLEEATSRSKGLHGSGLNLGRFQLPSLQELGGEGDGPWGEHLCPPTLIELEDDSLLLVGSSRCRGSPPSPGYSLLGSPLGLTRLLDRSSGDSANISECESRMEDSYDGLEGFHWPNFQGSDVEAGDGRRVAKGGEVKDVGYSSESQSNDETELLRLQMLENKFPGICQVASDIPMAAESSPGHLPHPSYYCMTTVDVDSTDRTDGDEGAEGGEDAKEAADSSPLSESPGTQPPVQRDPLPNMAALPDLLASTKGDWAVSSEQSETDGDPQEKIKELIDKAEELVRNGPMSPKRRSPDRKPITPVVTLVPKKVTAEARVTASRVLSSCDASAEETSDNDVGTDEFSTATDDAGDTLFDSVICLTSESRNTSQENILQSALPLDNVKLRTGAAARRPADKVRPWSVVELGDFDKVFAVRPMSTSEGAIDRLARPVGSSSPTPEFQAAHSATFPRPRGRGARRTVSTSSGHNSPRAAKRKLKFSSPKKSERTLLAARSSSSEEELEKHLSSETEEMVARFQQARMQTTSGGSSSGESDTETSDEYETPPMDLPTSENEDVLNSTGSFSENAWDNYQHMYPSVSEEATEEPLSWEPNDELEFDEEEFQNLPSNSIVSAALRKASGVKKAPKPKPVLPVSPSQFEDSDSDMEDLHDILDQSSQTLRLADSSLRKKRNDPMGTGLHPRPGKYAEIMATCDTNIKCLETIGRLLNSTDVTDEDINKMQDLLYQWEKLHALASERQTQAGTLATMATSLKDARGILKDAELPATPDSGYSSVDDLQSVIDKIQKRQSGLEAVKGQLQEVEEKLQTFSQQYPTIPLEKFHYELQTLRQANNRLSKSLLVQERSARQSLQLWYDYLEGRKELEYLLAEERQRLQKLLMQYQAGSLPSKSDALHLLERMQSNLSVYEAKLGELQSLHAQLKPSSGPDAHRVFLASIADLRNQLLAITQHSRSAHRDIEEDEVLEVDDTDFGRLAMPVATIHETMVRHSAGKQWAAGEREAEMGLEAGETATVSSCLWRLVKKYPVHIAALVLLAGLICLLDPDTVKGLADFSITISPELRYVNGPPPV